MRGSSPDILLPWTAAGWLVGHAPCTSNCGFSAITPLCSWIIIHGSLKSSLISIISASSCLTEVYLLNKTRASSIIPSFCTWPWGWVWLFQNTGFLSVELSSAIPPHALALAPHSCKTLFLSCSHLESWSVMLWVQPLRNNLYFPVMLFTEGGGKDQTVPWTPLFVRPVV